MLTWLFWLNSCNARRSFGSTLRSLLFLIVWSWCRVFFFFDLDCCCCASPPKQWSYGSWWYSLDRKLSLSDPLLSPPPDEYPSDSWCVGNEDDKMIRMITSNKWKRETESGCITMMAAAKFVNKHGGWKWRYAPRNRTKTVNKDYSTLKTGATHTSNGWLPPQILTILVGRPFPMRLRVFWHAVVAFQVPNRRFYVRKWHDFLCQENTNKID